MLLSSLRSNILRVSVGHYENFPVASHLVPARLRPAVIAIYRFARAADDLADEGDASAQQRLAALDAFVDELDAIARGEAASCPLFTALASAIRRHDLPIAAFHALLSAFRQDVVTTRYATFTALADYCSRSANPVGRLMLALFDADTPSNHAASDAICTGLQLANFWQDVASDWTRGRVYLPQEDLARFEVTEVQIAHAQTDGHWTQLMEFQTARTRALLDAGRPLLAALPWRARLEIGAVIAGGQRIVGLIDDVKGDVFRHRPVLGPIDWMAVVARTLVPPRIAAPVHA